MDLAVYKTQFEIKQEARYREEGKIVWSLLKCFFKYTQPITNVLQNLNQHQLSVFLRTIYSIPKRATSLIYRMEWFSLLCALNGMGHSRPPKQKKHKKVWASWKGNTTQLYASLIECEFVTVLSITSNIFWETQVKILGLGCERSMIWYNNVTWTKYMNLFFICSKKVF